MSQQPDLLAATERAPTNRLFAIYLLLAAPALLFPYRPEVWPLLLAIHLLGAAALLGAGPFRMLARRLDTRFPRVFRLIADWYPIILVPALYTELAVLNVAIWNGHYFDALIQHWEGALFGGQPSRDLAARFPNLVLSELLHGAYISYYLIIYAPALILYACSRRSAFRVMVFTVMFTFFVHYLVFIYFPVQGPRYLFPAPAGPIADGGVYALTHRLLEAGSARGAAFPSSHVGVSIAQTVSGFRFLPGLSPFIALLTLGLGAGAVYGGFHYAIDVGAGLLLGLAAALYAPRLRRLLMRARGTS